MYISISLSVVFSLARVFTYPVVRLEERLTPTTTWFSNTSVSTPTGTSFKEANPLSSRNAENAALSGANTVKLVEASKSGC